MGMPSLSVPVSILDRANSREGFPESDALNAVLARAGSADRLGYGRFWVAEHHAVAGIAGSAPAVLMAALAARTKNIRIGSGGVMLPNHQPLVVAEQAATLQALYPGRIDLGLGRSLGFTPAVRKALRAGPAEAEEFEAQLAELLAYLDGTAPITARPQDGGRTPVFVLATGAGVEIAARAGLGVVLGGPALFRQNSAGQTGALERYRSAFRPSDRFPRPYVLAAANVAVAGSEEEARELLLPEAHALADSRTKGVFPALSAAHSAAELSGRQQDLVRSTLEASVYGTVEQVHGRLEDLVASAGADELLVTGGAFDVEGQRESDRLLAGLF
ncbi:MsnO8 family LLM class oxidoreductase [Arthrobacter sp. zg-Y1110]|uniref:MsnO8 family LLM class oxidoreductase n=1 Tax=Arthrobacter sp. zg-Y1110 TaxID=2886932 RepID=UPI001D13FE39|nr:MsnO8 family LLM class oxidoreductase [Arthrobacter sp. zg-Y1110]MCC3289487.1 MsnO8 family LLM class oxidoreductase [Arthrobacter sp. zg-Y1110]UWX85076.1 MsnO8 family LLM class oxidoreductase [Arthrobacter sp. zg-Y1110]